MSLKMVDAMSQIKLPEEMEILEYASKVGSEAHIQMMRSCKPGMMEYHLESVFLHHCYMNGGARTAAYTAISASGPNSAILHYGHAGQPNGKSYQFRFSVLHSHIDAEFVYT